MADDDRRTNETIARACGWFPCAYGWCRTCGPDRDTGQTPRVPDYIADPARLPEMWALCREKKYLWSMGEDYPVEEASYWAKVWGWFRVPNEKAADVKPQRAFARALADALESE